MKSLEVAANLEHKAIWVIKIDAPPSGTRHWTVIDVDIASFQPIDCLVKQFWSDIKSQVICPSKLLSWVIIRGMQIRFAKQVQDDAVRCPKVGNFALGNECFKRLRNVLALQFMKPKDLAIKMTRRCHIFDIQCNVMDAQQGSAWNGW